MTYADKKILLAQFIGHVAAMRNYQKQFFATSKDDKAARSEAWKTARTYEKLVDDDLVKIETSALEKNNANG